MAFDPKPLYSVLHDKILVNHFHKYKNRYVERPAYQRKNVWTPAKKQALLSSLMQGFYIPRIVLREVRLSDRETRLEVIDGQQRITTMQQFFSDEIPLPREIGEAFKEPELIGKKYSQLHDDVKELFDYRLKFDADIVKDIDKPRDPEHLRIASEIFWRLQLGDRLNTMETAHARLSSLVRNFLVKYADDYDFDHESYTEVDPNPHEHVFFKETRSRTNSKMQNLALLGRFLLLELANGPTGINDAAVATLISDTESIDGIGNNSYENKTAAKETLRTLKRLHEVFRNDHRLHNKYGVMAFSNEYFTISCFLLMRHVTRSYAYSSRVRHGFREFVYDFFQRTKEAKAGEGNPWLFTENDQLNQGAIARRDQIIRQEFFAFLSEHHPEALKAMVAKDKRRNFKPCERITIYFRDKGLCQQCLADGKIDEDSQVKWNDFEADHVIPHSKGGPTEPWNGQVLCRTHNRQKGATV